MTGAPISSLPRLASTWPPSAVAPLVQEDTTLTVSLVHGVAVLGPAGPPHRPASLSPPAGRPAQAPASACAARGARQPDIERHQGALREAHQHGRALIEAVLGEPVVEKGIDERRGGARAGKARSGVEAVDAEPLEAHGIALARVGRVGRV